MNQSEVDAASISQDDLKNRLGRIAERDKFAVAYFAARCALRAMPLLAYDSPFECWNYKDQFRNVMAIWAAAIAVLSGQAGDSVRLIYAASQAATRAAGKGGRPVLASARSATAAAAYAADNYSYSSNAAYAYLDADDAFDAVGMSHIFRSAAHSDLYFMEHAEPPSLSSPLFEGVSDISLYVPYLTKWNTAIQKLKVERDASGGELTKEIATMPLFFERLISGNLHHAELVETARIFSEFFSRPESARGRKRGSKKTSEAATGAPDEAVESSAQASDLSSASISPDPIFEFEPPRRQSPEATSQEDHLNRLQLVNALAAILADPANDQHQTLGLLGEWGSGKSTWLGFLEQALLNNHPEQPFILGKYNAWAYEHTENLQAGIAHEMIQALVATPKDKNWFEKWWWGWKLKGHVAVALHGWWKMLTLLGKFLIAIVPFSVVITLVPDLMSLPTAHETAAAANNPTENASTNFFAGLLTIGAGLAGTLVLYQKIFLQQWKAIWASPEAKELLTYLKLPDYAKHLGEIPVMRKTLEKFCTARLKTVAPKTTRLLFVVDDLDRCSHQGIVKVFEAVRLVLDIPNVTVIIAVDQHIALAALALHYKELAEHHKLGNARAIARDYLAKVIHLPIILSRPNGVDVKNYLEKIWEKTAPQTQPQIPPPPLPFSTPSPASSSPQPAAGNPPAAESQTPVETPAEPNSSQMTSASAAVANADTSEPVAPPTLLKGLTFGQKNAFAYWAAYFELTNPRQLKRLNNTYSLLLNAFPSWDKKSAEFEFGGSSEKIFYPILIALVTLEYLNALEDPGLRRQLKAKLAAKDTEVAGHVLISADFLRLFAELGRDANVPLLSTLEPFVLPAIECEKEAVAVNTAQR